MIGLRKNSRETFHTIQPEAQKLGEKNHEFNKTINTL